MPGFADPAAYRDGRVPVEAFTAASFLTFEERQLWPRNWVCIGAASEIASPGDLLPYTVGAHGIHVQRQPDGRLVGRFNKAQHGGCHLVPLQCRTGKKTRCGFSACGYSLDRQAIRAGAGGATVPDMHQYLGVRPDALAPLAVRETGGLLFVSLDVRPDDADLASLPGLPPRALPARWATVEANWKLAAARLADGVPVDLTDRRFATTRPATTCSVGIVASTWIFPNLILLRSAEAACAIVLQPVAPTRTLCRVTLFAPAGDTDGPVDWTSHVVRQAAGTHPPGDERGALAGHWHRWMIDQALAPAPLAAKPTVTAAHAVHARFNVVA